MTNRQDSYQNHELSIKFWGWGLVRFSVVWRKFFDQILADSIVELTQAVIDA